MILFYVQLTPMHLIAVHPPDSLTLTLSTALTTHTSCVLCSADLTLLTMLQVLETVTSPPPTPQPAAVTAQPPAEVSPAITTSPGQT